MLRNIKLIAGWSHLSAKDFQKESSLARVDVPAAPPDLLTFLGREHPTLSTEAASTS